MRTKINGIFYLIIGIIVAVVSYFSKALRFFFYIGLLFIMIGVFKIIINKVLQPKEEVKTEAIKEEPRKEDRIRSFYKICPQCRTEYGINHNFCSICGRRLVMQKR